MSDNGSTKRAVLALVSLTVGAFTYVTAEILPIGLLLDIARDLDATESAVGMLVTGYGLVVVLASVPLTHLSRKVPRRHLLAGMMTMFTLAVAASALAPDYWTLLAARLVIALGQAVFWSVSTPAAAALFPARVRGRVVAVVATGGSLSGVLGVPAGTWIGQQAGWRTAFLAVAALGLITTVSIAALLPSTAPEQESASRGTDPDRRRYRMVVLMTIVGVTGSFCMFTYITPFLTQVTGFSEGAIALQLMVNGIAGVIGVTVVGWVVDRGPWTVAAVLIAIQAAALLGLHLAGGSPVPAAVLVALFGMCMGALPPTLGARILRHAPGRTDIASAVQSSAFNVGITGGALIGGLLLPAAGVRSVALAGGLLGVAALAVVLAEPLVARRGRTAGGPEAALVGAAGTTAADRS